MPYDEATSASVAQTAEKPGCVRRLVSGAGGMDKGTITKSGVAQSSFGNPYFTKDYWVSESQANTSSPLDPFEPVFALLITPVLPGSTIDFVVTCRIQYAIQFFDLRVSKQLGSKDLANEETFEQVEQ